MSCPMSKVKLSDKETAKFCQDGCSVICEELLREYFERRKVICTFTSKQNPDYGPSDSIIRPENGFRKATTTQKKQLQIECTT